jgi:hypothetical protein
MFDAPSARLGSSWVAFVGRRIDGLIHSLNSGKCQGSAVTLRTSFSWARLKLADSMIGPGRNGRKPVFG